MKTKNALQHRIIKPCETSKVLWSYQHSLYETTTSFYQRPFGTNQMHKKSRATNLKSLLLFLCFLLCSDKSYSQWSQINSGTNRDLNEVFFPVPDTGYIVGNKGTVLKTTNKGLSWSSLNLNVKVNLHELYFLNAKNGWIVGDSGTVCHTTDGGATWTYRYLPAAGNINLQSVYALNNSEIIVGGENMMSNNHIYKSINGGTTWLAASVESYIWSVNIFKIGMTSNTVGYAISRGFVLKTSDGGMSWRITDTASVHTYSMFSILEDLAYFPGNDTLFVCGWYPSYSAKTTNGGQKWSHKTNHDYTNLDFINPLVGYMGGWGVINKTTDGGLTYTDASGGNPQLFNNILSIDFTDEWTGYACGKNGLIIKTSNGGATSIEDKNNKSMSVLLYPNPTGGHIELSEVSDVIVTNLYGQIILKKDKVLHLDLSDQVNGVYIVSISDRSGINLQRTIVLKN